MSGLHWTRKTTRKLSAELSVQGFSASHTTVARLLHQRHYALRVNRKRLNRRHDPGRDRQMRYIARQRRQFTQAGFPVISVDTKKKELIGLFKNPGRTWRQQPIAVLETDFPSDANGKAIPYGIYDVARDAGYIVIGTSHETAEFAVAAIRAWWLEVGRVQYPSQHELLIEADGGGANNSRSWLWKVRLQALADECDLTITVTHYPPGASKWNPIEHRLFSYITHNWAGQPLLSYETLMKFINTTQSDTGLACCARLDTTSYDTAHKISLTEQTHINLHCHRIFPQWNYTIRPHPVAQSK